MEYMTPRERQALTMIVEYQRSTGGVSPRLDDIAAALRLKSKGAVHRVLVGLEGRGLIRRLPNRNRAIEVVRNPIAGMRAAWFRFDDEVKELVPFKGRQ